MSDEPDTLPAALARVQAQLPEINKSRTADTGAYSYTYADLANISGLVLPLLGREGLAFMAKPTWNGERFVLAYSLMHASGQREDGQYPLPMQGSPQQIGSAITYGRRYCLCAMVGVAPDEDDDGAAASGTVTRPRAEPVKAAKRTTSPRQNDEMTAAQGRKLHASFKERDMKFPATRHAYESKVLGRDVSSSSDLTRQEANAVIDALTTGVVFPDMAPETPIPDVPDPWQQKDKQPDNMPANMPGEPVDAGRPWGQQKASPEQMRSIVALLRDLGHIDDQRAEKVRIVRALLAQPAIDTFADLTFNDAASLVAIFDGIANLAEADREDRLWYLVHSGENEINRLQNAGSVGLDEISGQITVDEVL